MRRYTQKELKEFARLGMAENVTTYDFEQMNKLLKEHDLDKVGYSAGRYGINGGLLQDRNTGGMFVITARNTSLFMAF